MTNATNSLWKDLKYELATRGSTAAVFESVSLVLILVTAVVGNLFVCHVIRRNSRLHTFVFAYVFCQALSDVLMAVLVMPCTAVTLITGKWLLGDLMCNVQGMLILTFSWNSLHTMALVALNRFFRVVKPQLYRRLFTKHSVGAMIASALLLSILWPLLPLLFNWSSFRFHPGKSSCFIRFRDDVYLENTVYTGSTILLYIILPIIVISYSYTNVFRVVRRHQVAINPLPFGNSRLNVEEIKVTRILFFSMIAFAVCWLPVIIIEVVDTLVGDLSRSVHLTYVYLGYVSCAMNPLIYITMHRLFRAEMYRILNLTSSHSQT